MGLDFLKHYRGRRLRAELPPVFTDDEDETDDGEAPAELDLEVPRADWRPIDALRAAGADHLLPCRFIDGCRRGQTVAWVQDADGYPVPVMLAEVGGVCVARDRRTLRREFEMVERVVTMIIEPFPWHEIESFAVALRRIGLRLVPAKLPEDDLGHARPSFDFELMRRRTDQRANYEMEMLEELALAQDPHRPSLVDGNLMSRIHGLPAALPVVGLIKTHRESYLHDQGWRTLYDLRPGQRTPAFRLPSETLPLVTWYLRLADADGESPGYGIVRAEITDPFHATLPDPAAYINALSAWLVELRCRRQDYARAAISLDPIVYAEESLHALMSPPGYLKSWFYRHTGI